MNDAQVVSVWWKDSTLWANIIAVAALVINGKFGIQLTPEVQAAILGILNIVLKIPKMATTQESAKQRNAALKN